MLKTRRQRSFWARIKLSIILFQTPRRASDLNNFESQPRFLFLGTLTFKRKQQCKAIIHHFTRPFSPILCSTLIFLTKDFLLFGLFFFPFPLISKTGLLNTLLQGVAAKKNISQNRSFCQAPFAFFSFYFLSFFSSVRKKTKHQQRLPPSYRNIKKDNHLLLFQTLFGIINTHLYQTGLLG